MKKRIVCNVSFIFLLVFSAPLTARAEGAFTVTETFPGNAVLVPNAGVFMDRSSHHTFESIRQGELEGTLVFTGITDTNLGISDSTHWVRIVIANSLLHADDFFLQIRCPFINELDVYVVDARSGITLAQYSLGRVQQSTGPAPLFRFPVVPLELTPGETSVVYMKMHSTDNVFLDLVLYATPDFLKSSQNDTVFLTTIYGIIIAMILLNGILLIGTPDRQTVIYILYMACLLLYLLSADGVLFKVLTYRFPYLAVRSNYFMSIAAIMALLLFVRFYLEIDARAALSYRLLVAFLSIAFALLVSFAIASRFELLMTLAGVAEVMFLVFLFGVAVRAAFQRKRAAYYFLASWGVLIVLVFITQLRTLGLLSPGFLTISSLNIGAAFQVILLSVGLADRINTLLRENVLLKSERTRIEEEYRQKVGFFVNISHELRTPLTMLQGISEELLTGKYGDNVPRTHPEFLALKKNLDRIDSLIARISGIIRMDHRLSVPELKVVQLNTLLHEIASGYHLEIARKNINFEFTDLTRTVMYAELDSDLFRSAIENLLSNALQYTNSGSISLTLDTSPDASHAVISIQDTGIGIPAASIEAVFRRFTRLPEAQALRREGLGVGLHMVQKIVELHGAAISVRSTVGEGSQFSIRWPLLSAFSQAESSTDERLQKLPEQPRTEAHAANHGKHFSLLVVEDDPDLLEYLSTRLASSFSIQVARSAQLALGILESGYHPDIIISDIMMPGMDGKQLFARLHSMEAYASIPFLFLTARDLEEEKLLLTEQGAVDYITKPFSMDMLIARINIILGLRSKPAGDYLDKVLARCRDHSLSERQVEIVLLLVQGKSKKEIAASLKPVRGKDREKPISIKTVDNHIQKIYELFNVHSQYELIALCNPAIPDATAKVSST